MKSLIIFALLAATQAASLKRKLFQENFNDFNELIMREVGEELIKLYEKYEDDLLEVYSYLEDRDFAQLIAEMETLPEFNALIDFMEDKGVEIHFYIALLHEALGFEPYEYLRMDQTNQVVRQGNHSATRYLRELISLLPRDQLRSLRAEKMETDAEFRATMENLQSKDFVRLWGLLWSNAVFRNEVDQLRANGIEVGIVTEFVLATLGL